ncbi:hypothetical protein NDU88_002699 [Pleurodeles waltl]|uniref:Uncharacterized protein n=1 Tax=Pleurodeles waltl TaxID=8319 RepID=A0AAV7W3Y4_PLEWA|nr:hypothetical protein NDU88_002699 [Pleurodeles waltl]
MGQRLTRERLKASRAPLQRGKFLLCCIAASLGTLCPKILLPRCLKTQSHGDTDPVGKAGEFESCHRRKPGGIIGQPENR